MIERRLILQYHEGCSMMTLVEVAIFSADHSLAAVDLRALESTEIENISLDFRLQARLPTPTYLRFLGQRPSQGDS